MNALYQLRGQLDYDFQEPPDHYYSDLAQQKADLQDAALESVDDAHKALVEALSYAVRAGWDEAFISPIRTSLIAISQLKEQQ